VGQGIRGRMGSGQDPEPTTLLAGRIVLTGPEGQAYFNASACSGEMRLPARRALTGRRRCGTARWWRSRWGGWCRHSRSSVRCRLCDLERPTRFATWAAWRLCRQRHGTRLGSTRVTRHLRPCIPALKPTGARVSGRETAGSCWASRRACALLRCATTVSAGTVRRMGSAAARTLGIGVQEKGAGHRV
jgi:hypothetical protein